jgi:phosphate butyryltransferase
MRSLREVRDSLLAREKKRIAVAAAEDRPVLEAVKEAVQMGIAEATLCGDEAKIRQIAEEIELDVNKVTIVNEPDIRKSAEAAVKLVHNGEAQLVMKGLIGTADFLRAVLNKEWGLRTGKILSHVAVFDSVKLDRLILMTDAAMVMYPTLEEKIAMINNTIPVCQALEIEDPKAAAVCAVEVLNPSMQPTLDAASLAIMSQRGQFKGITVDGPLALDNALNEDAARHKGIKSPVAGHADVLLMHCPVPEVRLR